MTLPRARPAIGRWVADIVKSWDTAQITDPAETACLIDLSFLPEGWPWNELNKVRNMPCTIVQGRYDIVCPPITAEALARAWPEARFVIVPDAGHSALEPRAAPANFCTFSTGLATVRWWYSQTGFSPVATRAAPGRRPRRRTAGPDEGASRPSATAGAAGAAGGGSSQGAR